jgi:chemotaxis protein methyltransferase CheR
MMTALRQQPRNAGLEDEVVDAMTIGGAQFLNDRPALTAIDRDVLPRLILARTGTRRLRLWWMGASAGQEPYSLAMQLKEREEARPGWQIEIVATDPSAELLEKARSGLYSHFEVQRGLPAPLLARHFERRGELWQISAAVRAMVRFRRIDLTQPLGGLGTFDAVFCRGALGGYDAELREAILRRVADRLAGDGVLAIDPAGAAALPKAFAAIDRAAGIFAKIDAPQGARRTAA